MEYGIIPFPLTRFIRITALRNEYDHSLTGTGKQHAICVFEIQFAFLRRNGLPAVADEVIVRPLRPIKPEIGVPGDYGIIKLEPLNVEF